VIGKQGHSPQFPATPFVGRAMGLPEPEPPRSTPAGASVRSRNFG
jgi:hypothetical protein